MSFCKRNSFILLYFNECSYVMLEFLELRIKKTNNRASIPKVFAVLVILNDLLFYNRS